VDSQLIFAHPITGMVAKEMLLLQETTSIPLGQQESEQ
jgi:hypothetical protein